LRGGRLLASIEHRNIVDVFHADQVDGIAFLVMRLIKGVDLGSLLRDRERLEPAEVGHIVSEVAEALDAAHRLGLVHRDVKPGNILVAAAGGPVEQARVYLTDFGLTKRHDAPTELTMTGQFVGTVDYVAPEQIQGAPIDGRADLYALACVAYECLAGRPPFQGEHEAAALMAHMMTQPPDITRLRPGLPRAAADALLKGMAKSRDERHATCAEFAADLLAGLSAADQPPTSFLASRQIVPVATLPTVRPSSEPAWASDPTVQLAVPAPPPAAPRARAIRQPVTPESRHEDDHPYDTEYGVARRNGPRSRRRRRGGLLLGILALLLVVGGAAVVYALNNQNALRLGTAGSPGPSPTLDPAALRARLRAQIPAQFRSECSPGAAVAPVLAVQECNLEEGRVRVVYSLFADTESMDAAYVGARSQLGVPPDSGQPGNRCLEGATWPNEGPYTYRNAPTGRLLCTFVAGQTRFEWTDSRVDVMTSATDGSGSDRRLFRLWRDGRLPPLASPTPEPPPTPTPEPPATPTEVPTDTSTDTPPEPS
jgi:serine/threonine-protein kinase